MSEEISDCPFCGANAIIEKVRRGMIIVNDDPGGRVVICTACQARTKIFPATEEKEAIRVWNYRYIDSTVEV